MKIERKVVKQCVCYYTIDVNQAMVDELNTYLSEDIGDLTSTGEPYTLSLTDLENYFNDKIYFDGINGIEDVDALCELINEFIEDCYDYRIVFEKHGDYTEFEEIPYGESRVLGEDEVE